MKKSLYGFIILFFISACAQEQVQEITIIGGGLMGSSTAWQLSNAGQEVLLLEQQDTVYTFGSSQGEARIARSLGPRNDKWSYLHNRSVKEAQQLIDFLNAGAKHSSHRMEDIYTTSPVTYVRHTKQLARIEGILEGQTDRYKYAATPEEGAALFQAALPDTALMLREYKQHSGTINPKALIHKMHQGVKKKGNTIWYKHRVNSLRKKGELYELKLTDLNSGEEKRVLTKKVVSAAGPYTGQLLKDVAPYVDSLINPQRVFLGFFKINEQRYQSYTEAQRQQLIDAYPVINSTAGTRDGSFFSMIEYRDEQGNPLIKIGGHFQRSDIQDLDQVWKKELSEKEINWGKQNTLKYLRLLQLPIEPSELEYTAGYSCVYSLTKTEVPYVTPLPLANQQPNPNLLMLGGMSGVGAKGAMTYGRIAAGYLLNKEETGERYQEVKAALGFERLLKDLQ